MGDTKKINAGQSGIRTFAGPFAWLALTAGLLSGLHMLELSVTVSFIAAIFVSLTIVLLASRPAAEDQNRITIPVLGAGLFALLAWSAISFIPAVPFDDGLSSNAQFFARSIVVVSAVVLAMPVLALAELLFSMCLLQIIARADGESTLGGELRVVSMIDRKFGGVLGSLNR